MTGEKMERGFGNVMHWILPPMYASGSRWDSQWTAYSKLQEKATSGGYICDGLSSPSHAHPWPDTKMERLVLGDLCTGSDQVEAQRWRLLVTKDLQQGIIWKYVHWKRQYKPLTVQNSNPAPTSSARHHFAFTSSHFTQTAPHHP